MKLNYFSPRRLGGFTVVEMMISIGVLGLLGGVFFSVLNSGIVLFAKNTAVNAAHEQTRQGINRLTRDIHAAISIPQLRTATFAVKSPQPPASNPAPTPIAASAVSFQNIAAGPHLLWQDPGSASLIKIKDFGVAPELGMRLIVPFWGVEDNIIKVASNGTANHTNVFLEKGWTTSLPRAEGGAYAVIYYTDRVMYCVLGGRFFKDPRGDYMPADFSKTPDLTDHTNWTWYDPASVNGNGKRYSYEGGELRVYKQRYINGSIGWKQVAVVARELTTPMPFSVPLNSGGTANTKYVSVKIAAKDPKSSNRGYVATNSLLDTQIDYRAAITTTQ